MKPERLAERETILYRLGSEFNRILSNYCGNPIISVAKKHVIIFAAGSFVRMKPFTPKKKSKKEVDYFWKHQKSISDYDKVFENSIPFRKKDLRRIKILEYRACRAFQKSFAL